MVHKAHEAVVNQKSVEVLPLCSVYNAFVLAAACGQSLILS